MDWVASTLHTTSKHGVSSITTTDAHTSADAPADLNGLVRFAERRNLVSARVQSHFNWPLRQCNGSQSRINQEYVSPKLYVLASQVHTKLSAINEDDMWPMTHAKGQTNMKKLLVAFRKFCELARKFYCFRQIVWSLNLLRGFAIQQTLVLRD